MGAESNAIWTETDLAATTNSSALPVLGGTMAVVLDVTDAPGSATLDIAIQYSGDGVNWDAPASAQTFTQVTTSTVTECLRFDTYGKYFRFVATIGGSGASYDLKIVATQFT